MNEKFFQLPKEKQQRIINAGFRVFAQNSYKKSPMSEIAAEAGISKSLLFFYFRNKRELYLFLWEEAADITLRYLTEYRCYEPGDLFVMMERGMMAKFRIIQEYPHMAFFAVKAFYEKDAEIVGEVQESYRRHFDRKAAGALARIDPGSFVPGLDLRMMYREIYWASEGYLWEMVQKGELDVEKMERDFRRLLQFWKSVYQRKEEADAGDTDAAADEILREEQRN